MGVKASVADRRLRALNDMNDKKVLQSVHQIAWAFAGVLCAASALVSCGSQDPIREANERIEAGRAASQRILLDTACDNMTDSTELFISVKHVPALPDLASGAIILSEVSAWADKQEHGYVISGTAPKTLRLNGNSSEDVSSAAYYPLRSTSLMRGTEFQVYERCAGDDLEPHLVTFM